MTPVEPSPVEDVFETIYQQFIRPVRERLKQYDQDLIREMRDQDYTGASVPDEGYDNALQNFLGGIGSGAADTDNEPTVIKALWRVMEILLRKWGGGADDILRAAVLQTFSNATVRQPGRQMWAAREIAPTGSDGNRVRSLIHAVWYLRGCRAYDPRDTPNEPVGLYNLLMNPQFFDVFRSHSARWYPQPLLITTSDADAGPVSPLLPELRLAALVERLGGKVRLDACRQDLRGVTAATGLSDAARWGEVGDEHLGSYRGVIDRFVAESLGDSGVGNEVEEVRENLASVLCDKEKGAWAKLPSDGSAREQALTQLRGISAPSLLRTLLFLLLHEPDWTHYYYFVFGSVPNTSGPSLALFTAGSLRPYLQVCAQYLLTEGGKHLAILETQKLAAGRAEERMSYFGNLQTHTFTKGFTTPVHNETMRLEAAVPRAFNLGAAGRAQDRLRRFEYAMQSSEFLGVGEVREDEPDTFRYAAESIDATLCQRLVTDLHHAARRGIELRLNDLFDDPEFAGYSGIDPTRDFGTLADAIELPSPGGKPGGFFADFPLLAYHLQSLVQNATEAIDLVAAWQKTPQTVQVSFGVEEDRGRRYAVFSIANTCSEQFPTAVCENINDWQAAVRTGRASARDWSPRSTKSGGHSGMGLLLAATFCQAIRVDGPGGEPRAQGQLVIVPGASPRGPAGSGEPVHPTAVSLWFPLPAETHGAGEEVWIDRRILLLAPSLPTTSSAVATRSAPPGSDRVAADASDRPPLGLDPDDARDTKVLIVEDDTADRQRFRLHLQQRYPTTPDFHTNVAFAWDARKRQVPPPGAICDFLARKGTATKVFLDLAWDGEDEDMFRQLRTARNFDQYSKTLDGWGSGKRGPKGLLLLRLLAEARKEGKGNLPPVQVIVVTAYKSQYLMRYLGERYARRAGDTEPRLVVERPFMKWSDGERLKDFIG